LLSWLIADIVFRRSLPSRFGGGGVRITVRGAGLRALRPNLADADPTLFRLAEEVVSPGHRIWDIGANVGFFTLAAANRAGPDGEVLAVEPDVDLVRLLLWSRRELDRARNAPVDVLCAAISATAGVARLVVAGRARASNALLGFGHSQMGVSRETRSVATLSLDDLLAAGPRPDVVKIDAEGAEAAIIRGAGRLLAEVRPVLAIEVTPGPVGEEVTMALTAAGYLLYDAEAPPGERLPLATAPWNCLAVPRPS
jgi:FkbM family methyltransferase